MHSICRYKYTWPRKAVTSFGKRYNATFVIRAFAYPRYYFRATYTSISYSLILYHSNDVSKRRTFIKLRIVQLCLIAWSRLNWLTAGYDGESLLNTVTSFLFPSPQSVAYLYSSKNAYCILFTESAYNPNTS